MIQLKLRTEYSFGQTYAPIQKVIARLQELGCKAAGIVDRHSTWGHVKWHNACLKAGIQPLLGLELAVGDEGQNMWFLARNTAGLSALYAANSKAHRQLLAGRRGTIPALTRDDVVALAGSPVTVFAGEVTDEPFLLSIGAVLDLSPSSRVLNHAKRAIAGRTGLRLVGVSDHSYPAPEHKQLFELIADRGLKPSPQHILTDLEGQDIAAAIAAECAGLQLPKAPMVRMEGNLEELCRAGIAFRKMKWDEVYEKRLMYELDLIKQKDFDSYFLIVADMVQYAKQHMLVGPSRGSAAGSLVCYLARITELNPIVHGLSFERFIDATRRDLPDIDLDFPDDKRHLVFEYMAQKYGADQVSHIGTVSTYKPKSALIQVCKKLNIPPAATGQVKAAIIERSSADERHGNCLLDTFETTEPGKKFISQYPNARLASELEGHASHSGVHAAGLLVANSPMTNYASVDQHGIAQIEKDSAEALGLLKIDVLGLRTLGVLEDAGVPVDWYDLTFDDPEVYKMFNSGRMCGIFQFEGRAMRDVSREVKFTGINHIDAVTALARPGPFMGGVTQKYIDRMNGKSYEALHPLVEKAMEETYGLPIYQEQTMAIVRDIGKFNWEQVGVVRKTMSKRMGKEFMDKQLGLFIDGAEQNGVSAEEATAIWNTINGMGAWQMNKAHTRSYAVISYWAAWLKVHYPLEFAAANLRNAKDEDTALKLLREMVGEGFKYTAFDIDRSQANWSVQDGELVAGFNSLKGFGETTAKKFVEARAAGALTAEMRAKALAADNIFLDIFPISNKYRELYEAPEKQGINGPVLKLNEFDGSQNGSFVFLGKVIKKNQRDINEEALIKRRNGKQMQGPKIFIDVTVQDDTEAMIARLNRYQYLKYGQELEQLPIGSHLLVRASFKQGIRFGFIDKYKVLE